MQYTEFTKDYYFDQISSNTWIDSMTINNDIIDQISSLSVGILRDCSNHNCNYEVSINAKESNLFETICTTNNSFDPRDSIRQIATECQNKDAIYFHDPTKNISYCTDCSKSMKPCSESAYESCCKGVIFEKANNSFMNCSCIQNSRVLCLNHGKCDKCDTTFIV